MISIRNGIGVGLAFCALTLAAGTASAADASGDFYKGKQISLVVGSGPGGIYDVYARILAKHMPGHISGKPNIVVQNMVGASGLKAANFIATVAPRDGLTIAATLSSAPMQPLISPKAAKFDSNKLSWIGSITKDPFVGYVWHNAPALTYEDMKKREVIMGGNSVGAAGVDMAILSNAMFGTKIKIVTGYPGSAEVKLALEKGELQGTFANGWGDLKTQKPEWLRDKKVIVVIQHGFKRHKGLPDVPLLMDQAKTKEDRQALVFMLARQEFSKPYVAPPGVPAERLAVLRRAFDATMADPKFVADVEKARITVDGPLTGEELAQMVAEVAATPPAVVARVQKLLDDFKAGNKKKK